jgi:hypothetical protein
VAIRVSDPVLLVLRLFVGHGNDFF